MSYLLTALTTCSRFWGFFFHFQFLNSTPLLHEHRQIKFLFFGPRLTAFIDFH